MSGPVAVFDVVILLQAFTKPQGPAAACWTHVLDGRVSNLTSESILAELADVTSRPKLMKRLRYSEEEREDFLAIVREESCLRTGVSHWFNFPRDPKDEKLLDLAIEASARFIVTWDNDLLDLMKSENEFGQTLHAQAPDLRIVTPPEFLEALRRAEQPD